MAEKIQEPDPYRVPEGDTPEGDPEPSVYPKVGPSVSYTFTEDDIPDPNSGWSGYGLVKIWKTWTPEVTGVVKPLPLPTSSENDNNQYAYIYKGDTIGVDFPDPQATSFDGNNGNLTLLFQQSFSSGAYDYENAVITEAYVQAGQPYTIILIDSDAVVGDEIILDGLLSSLAPLGGLDESPPPVPEFFGSNISTLPSGKFSRLPTIERPPSFGGVLVVLHSHSGVRHTSPSLYIPLGLSSDNTSYAREVTAFDILDPGDHAGPHIEFYSSNRTFVLKYFEYGVIRADGTAALVIAQSAIGQNNSPFFTESYPPYTFVPSNSGSSEYNTDEVLDWQNPIKVVGTDLTVDPTGPRVLTAAGGPIYMYAQFNVSVGPPE